MSKNKTPRFWLELTKSKRVLDIVEDEMPKPHIEYLSIIEHESILKKLKAEVARLREVQEENAQIHEAYDKQFQKMHKLKWQLNQFKAIGTDACNSCEGGRVTIFMANQECISCNPRSYDAYEQRQALSDSKEKTK